MERILRYDSRELAAAASEQMYDEECLLKGCPTSKIERTTKYKFSVRENILSGQFGLHVPEIYWAELSQKYHNGVSLNNPLWIDEQFINGEPHLAIGSGVFGFEIVDPKEKRKILEGNFSPELLAETRSTVRRYDSIVREKAAGHINAILKADDASRRRQLETIDPFAFEELTAELLNDNGFDVFLTPRSNDGGKDIIAAYPDNGGIVLVIVECKRRKVEKTLGPTEVRALLGTYSVENAKEKGFTFAMMVTTARKLGPAGLECVDVVANLSVKTYDKLMEWIESYGKIRNDLWVPQQFKNVM